MGHSACLASLACLDLPALPLQLLAKTRPQLRDRPAVVLESDGAQARVTHVNRAARRLGVLPGQRYAAALALCSELESGVIELGALIEAREQLLEALGQCSPRVELSEIDDPGVFWLDVRGLTPLYDSLQAWAHESLGRVRALGFEGRLVLGFSRLGSFALARSGPPGTLILPSLQEEQRASQEVELARLGLSPRDREALARLGVHTLAELLRLPSSGLRQRYGAFVHRLHQLASAQREQPLAPSRRVPPLSLKLALDEPEADCYRLLFGLKERLDALLRLLDARGEALAELQLSLQLEGGEPRCLWVRPSVPTLDGPQLVDLLRLQLERTPLARGVVEAELQAEGRRLSQRQTLLFASKPRRDLAAGARALARLRAELGEAAVGKLCLQQVHLPEAQVAFEPCPELLPASPQAGLAQVVRRFWRQALPLPRARHGPAGLVLPGAGAGGGAGTVSFVGRPARISGGWWQGEVRRRYHYVQTARGAILWIYFDELRQRWRLQGRLD